MKNTQHVSGEISCCQIFPVQPCSPSVCLSFRFLRCSPFDEYKLWKAQVDNGSRRGQQRLNILTRSLLLRRTKDQLDSSGKFLVGTYTQLGRFIVKATNFVFDFVIKQWIVKASCRFSSDKQRQLFATYVSGASSQTDLRGTSTQTVPGWTGCIRCGLCPIQVTQQPILFS